jgi:bacillithiol synthase
MTERPIQVLDYGAFPQPPNPLFRDYLAGAARLAPFFAGGRWDIGAIGEAGARAAGRARERQRLAEVLANQQRGRGAVEAEAAARRLADDRTVAVVTGQQAVLFGGPLYVLYKALAAMRVARELEQQRGIPAVPVFWVASDDHDFAEIRSTTVLDEAGRLHTFRLNPQREPIGQPAWRILLDDGVAGLVEEAATRLPASPFRQALVAQMRACYAPGESLSGAFARFLAVLLPGLVVLDPADPELKRLSAAVVRREIEEGSPTSRLAAETGRALLGAGYHQQVPVRDGFLNLFLLADGERRALALRGEAIEVRGTPRRLAVTELIRRLDEDPQAFSPGVLLRPLVQDHLLPTATYIGGPGEIAYHAQIGPSYAAFAIPRPVLLPRPSLTLIEPSQRRALEAESLTLMELEDDPEALLARWAREAYPEVEAAFERTRETLGREMAAVEETLARLDPTLRAAADAARGRALHQVETLHEKATRALKKRDQARADRLRRTRDALFPGGSFQERGLGLIGALARHGPALVDEIRDRMDPWARGHQVLYL